MIKSIVIIILALVMSFNIMAINTTLNNEIKRCIGKDIQDIDKEIKKLNTQGKLKLICEKQQVITDIFIRSKDVDVDSIKVGDKLKEIYEIYPKSWIHEHDKGIMILKGKDTHYGIPTEYIIFLSEDKEHISEIQIGYTADFTRNDLPDSNSQAIELLQGKWVSQYGKIIEFDQGEIRDNQFEDFDSKQRYIITSPNEMIIYRGLGGQIDKLKLRFWVMEDNLYIFSVNTLGMPIRDTVEKFNKIN